MTVAADAAEAVAEEVRAGGRVLPVAGGTKPALSTPPSGDVRSLDVSGLRGMVEYDPAELTLTALAGTPVAELAATLAEHGQYLPFDPPLAHAGATLGGVVAAATAGPNAYRYGGVRDFVVGVRFVDGLGRLVSGGGRVVKNAAGFDLPKLLVGSMGRLGVLVEVSLKVFPVPRAFATFVFDTGSLTTGLAAVARLGRGPVEPQAVDLEPSGRVLVRVGGVDEALQARGRRVGEAVGAVAETLTGEQDAELWRAAAELEWVPDSSRLVRVALTGRSVPALDAVLAEAGADARYSLGANVAWVAWPADRPLDGLDGALTGAGLAGVVLTGPPERVLLGVARGGVFAERVRGALDPHSRFATEV